MKKKVLSIFLALGLLFSLLPTAALAAETTTAYVIVNNVWIMDAANYTVACGGGTAVYEPSTKTLTLTDATFGDFSADQSIGMARISSNVDLNIVLVGVNQFLANDKITVGMQVAGNLTISGSGSLTAANTAYPLLFSNGDLTIKEGTIDVSTSTGNAVTSTDGGIIISGGTITANATGAAPAIAGGNITISGGTVTATSTSSNGIYARNALAISGTAEVEVTGAAPGLYAESNMTLSGGTIKASGNNGIYTGGTLTINGTAKVEAMGAYPGLYAKSNILLSGTSKVDATSSDDTAIFTPTNITVSDTANITANGKLFAISANGNTNITGGTVHATASTQDGIYSGGTIAISGNSDVTATGEWAGVRTGPGDLTIASGTVKANGKSFSGLYSGKNISITGGTITATSTAQDGIYSTGAISVTGEADITATGEWSGLRTINGDLTLSGSTIKATGKKEAVSAGKDLRITGGKVQATSADQTAIYATNNLSIDGAVEVTATGGWSGLCGKDSVNITNSSINAIGQSDVGITSHGSIAMTGGTIHAKGGIGRAGIGVNFTKTGDVAATAKITVDGIAERDGGKIAFTDWYDVTDPAETRNWTAFIAKDVAALTVSQDNSTNALNEVWLGAYSNSSGGDYTPPSSGSGVTVDGKNENIGKTETKNGTTTVTIDSTKLDSKVETAKSGSSVVVPVTTTANAAAAQFAVSNVESMAAKNMTLTVQAKGVNYELPTSAIDTKGIVSTLGATDAAKVPFTVTITSEKNVKVEGATVVGTPISFTVTATYGGKSVTVDRFDTMVARTMEITKEQASKITTAVVVKNGKVIRHVPTYVYDQNGKYYARINSMTNSTYAIIANESAVTDTAGKWYEAAANELSAREITKDIWTTSFDGDKAITRAEFAALLVNAFGLPRNEKADYGDVPADAWYSTFVATATEYGIVNGIGGNLFAPNATITRQEAMVMLARAAEVVGYDGKPGALTTFSDVTDVGAWAMDGVTFSVGSGIILGKDNKLMPRDNITRGETATVVLRLLQQAELVDVRAET